MAASTLGGVSLGYVTSVGETKNANIEIIPRPRSDSAAALTYDFFGATRELTIAGKITATSIANLKTAMDNLRALISGNQANTISLVTDVTGTVSVLVREITFEWTNEAQGKADYSIGVIEGLTPAEVS